MVGGQRGERVGLPGKEDDPDPVRGTALDEGLDDRLDGLEAIYPLPVLLVILAQHRSRQVDCQDDVVALGADLPLVVDLLRPGQGADEQGQSKDGESSRPVGGARRGWCGARPRQTGREGPRPARGCGSTRWRAARPARGATRDPGAGRSAGRERQDGAWSPGPRGRGLLRRASARGRTGPGRRSGRRSS